jgi:hypothetical protein
MNYYYLDPDSTKFGVCQYDSNENFLRVFSWSLFAVIDCLNYRNGVYYLENIIDLKSNFHGAKNERVAFKIGECVGRCKQNAILLNEYCTHSNIKLNLIRPLNKHGHKINHNEIITALKQRKIHYSFTRTNQDERDAIELFLHHYFVGG